MSEAQCQAQAHRYVGKGNMRVLHTGPCVLPERGHDGEHLPASLAYAQLGNAAYNQAITEVLSLIDTHESNKLSTPLREMVALLKKEV